MKIRDLLHEISILEIIGDLELEVNGIQFNSRCVKEGDLFIAQKGTVVDGHAYIDECIKKGASAIMIDNHEYLPNTNCNVTFILVKDSNEALGKIAHAWYGHPTKKLQLIGVTGTNGKTTTATLLYKLFKSLGFKVGLLSTVVNYINDKAIPSTHTTPDAIALNALLAEMVTVGCTYAFMEVSSHSIAQNRIAGLNFTGALFTNITRDHLDYHKTFDHYRDTKKHLFDSLPKTAFAITNIDDKNGLVMTQNTKAKVHTYSTRSMADFRGKILEEGFDGMLLRMQSTIGAINTEVFVPLVGLFNLSNLLLIYGCGVVLGIEPMDVLRILSNLTPVNGRFETIQSQKGWTAIIDYAHTPDAVEKVLQTINEIITANAHKKTEPTHIITVVGTSGNRDKGKRPIMARIAYDLSTQLILTSDNPRDEDPYEILRDMANGLTDEELQRTLIIEDRASAIKTACSIAQKGDIILVAGKGHEDYQIIKGVKYHFDDHEIVQQCAKH